MPTQNLLLRSEEFDNASWTKSGGGDVVPTISANTADTLAPNGTQTADKFTDGNQAGVAVSLVLQTHTEVANGALVTASCCIKAGTKTFVALAGDDAVASGSFNLTTGAFVVDGGLKGIGVVSLGNGWWKCWITWNRSYANTARLRIYMESALSVTGYRGDGTGTFYLWGAQIEQADGPGDYVAATSAVVNTGAPANKRLPQNLLLRSNDFGSASWTKNTGVTATSNSTDVTDPLGTTTSSKIVYDGSGTAGVGRIYQLVTTSGGRQYAQGVWLRTASGTATLRLSDDSAAGTSVPFTVDTTWRFFSFSSTAVAGVGYYSEIKSPAADNSAFTVYAWHSQLEQSDAPGDYIGTAAAGTAVNVVAPAKHRI